MNRLSGSWSFLAGILLVVLITVTPPARISWAAQSADALLFIAGFNAYQGNDCRMAVDKLSQFLQEHPASPLRDVTLYWLARALYGVGDRHQAAHTMAGFLREYPAHPLAGSGETDLLTLAAEYGRQVDAPRTPATPPPSPP